MSTILKALQRLEDEKSANSERSLNEQVVAHRPPSAPERRHGLRIGAVAIGGLAVAAAAFFFWPTQEEPDAEVAMGSPPPAMAPAVAATTEVAAKKPRRKRSARPAPAARVQQDPSEIEISPVVEVVEHLDAPPADTDVSADSGTPAAPPKIAAQPAKAKPGAERPTARARAGNPETQVARRAKQPRSASKQIADPKPPAPQISESSVLATPASALPAPVEIAAVAPKPVPPAVPTPIPAVAREPERKIVQRATLPVLSIEKTIWHPDADRRVAVVRLVDTEKVLRLKEGDAVGPLVVIDIAPGSVLFNHDNIEIRYNVGG